MRSPLRWFDQIHQIENDHALKSTDRASVPGKGLTGRAKQRWIDIVNRDLKILGLKFADFFERIAWKDVLSFIDSMNATQNALF